jgi:hypothetical protein
MITTITNVATMRQDKRNLDASDPEAFTGSDVTVGYEGYEGVVIV